MAKSKTFAFALGQRVNVPGKKNVQGVIGLPTHTGEMNTLITGIAQAPLAHHAYLVRFLQEDGIPTFAWYGDFDLTFANLEPAAAEAAAEAAAATKVVATALGSDFGTMSPARSSARKQKPTRKSKSKKRKQ